jgi:hypothetical protein
MSQCLNQCAYDRRIAASVCGRWYRNHGAADALRPQRPVRRRWRTAARVAGYVFLLLLPGGGLFVILRWLYMRFDISNREWVGRLKTRFAGLRETEIDSARLDVG